LLITAANLFIAAIANLPITVMKRKRALVNRRCFCVYRTDKIGAVFVISRPTSKHQNSPCHAADTETTTKLIKKPAPSFSTIYTDKIGAASAVFLITFAMKRKRALVNRRGFCHFTSNAQKSKLPLPYRRHRNNDETYQKTRTVFFDDT
jgi:hypothetical protein